MTRTASINWTNKSVLLLAQNDDPIATMERLARATVLEAMDAGWSGPPFNPVNLASHLKVAVEPDAFVRDAQTVATNGGLKIKYNPSQARERLRFSIAHEVAHSLFPDCGDMIRNRGGDASQPDDWQLELLCNIAAAEFIMPLGSLRQTDEVPPIQQLLIDRRKFDVSVEAYLMRIAKTSSQPLVMFVASPRNHVAGNAASTASYKVDYRVVSPSWRGFDVLAVQFETDSVVGRCRSIGHTEHGVLHLNNGNVLHVEAVGVPAYPGESLPRVVGLIRPNEPTHKKLYQSAHGDVLSPRGGSRRIVCQLVNDQARIWGGGVARASARKWPEAQQAFSTWISSLPRQERLGKVHVWRQTEGMLLSLVAQHGIRQGKGPMIRYAALDTCLAEVAELALSEKLPVQSPKLGTGAAGADWKVVEQLLLDKLVARGVNLTIVEPPPPKIQESLL
jgi:hypothetical protein